MLRTLILGRLGTLPARSLAVCSARDGEGKSFVAVNLALSLSQTTNHHVLLADLDLQQPSVHRYLGLEVGAGVDDVLAGRVEVSDCLVSPGFERLSVLPVRKAASDTSQLLASAAVERLTRSLAAFRRDGIVIYDVPPVLFSDDCLAVVAHVDACLLVVEEGTTTKSELERVLSLLEDRNLVGTVLNKASDLENKVYKYY